MIPTRKPIDRAIAKNELERINEVLTKPHLLIGGLAVQQYYSARTTKDIDLVCDFELVQTILKKLYPTKDWRITDSKNSEYRPSFHIHHKVDDMGTIIFGPKISEREPYSHLDWKKLEKDAKPFRLGDKTLRKILVPPVHALAYAKLISFLCRQNPENKVEADLQDFCDLSNCEGFSATLFYDFLRQSRAAEELIRNFRKKIASFPKIAEASCLHSLSELYHAPISRRVSSVERPSEVTIYLAAPHKNIAKNNKIKNALSNAGFRVLLPYEEVEAKGLNNGKINSKKIRNICKSAIDRSNILLVDLDTYGMDTAWEIGYAEGLNILVIGYNEDVFLSNDARHINRRFYNDNFMHGWNSQQILTRLSQVKKIIMGKKVYVCGPFKHPLAGKKTRDELAKSATTLIFPKDYIVKQEALPRDYPLSDRYETINLLKECDILLVDLPRYGMDSSWQIGYATAQKKKIIGWKLKDDGRDQVRQSFWDHWMHGWKSKLHVVGIKYLVALVEGIAIQMKENNQQSH